MEPEPAKREDDVGASNTEQISTSQAAKPASFSLQSSDNVKTPSTVSPLHLNDAKSPISTSNIGQPDSKSTPTLFQSAPATTSPLPKNDKAASPYGGGTSSFGATSSQQSGMKANIPTSKPGTEALAAKSEQNPALTSSPSFSVSGIGQGQEQNAVKTQGAGNSEQKSQGSPFGAPATFGFPSNTASEQNAKVCR